MNKINGCIVSVHGECHSYKIDCKYYDKGMGNKCKDNYCGTCLNADANNEAIKEWIEEMNCTEENND